MKKFIALMVITGFLAATAPRALAESAGGVQHPWYNPPAPQTVPEVPVVPAPATTTHPPVEAAGAGAGLSTGMMVGIGAALVGAVALAAGGGGGGAARQPQRPPPARANNHLVT